MDDFRAMLRGWFTRPQDDTGLGALADLAVEQFGEAFALPIRRERGANPGRTWLIQFRTRSIPAVILDPQTQREMETGVGHLTLQLTGDWTQIAACLLNDYLEGVSAFDQQGQEWLRRIQITSAELRREGDALRPVTLVRAHRAGAPRGIDLL